MRHIVGSWSGIHPADPRVLVQQVDSNSERIRISGESNPPWRGPAGSARVIVDDRELTVRAVEYGFGGRFAVEAEGELRDGSTITIRLGDGWAVLEVFRD